MNDSDTKKTDLAIVIFGCLTIVGVSVLMRGFEKWNVASVGLGLLVMFTAFRWGPVSAFWFAVGCGIFTGALSFLEGVSTAVLVTTLATLLVGALFPIPWIERQEKLQEDFDEAKQPLEQTREQITASLAENHAQLRDAEKRSRETDALYHVGREISKVLTLKDMIAFSLEAVQDTLVGLAVEREVEGLSFAILLGRDTPGGGFYCAAAWQIPPEAADALAASLEKKNIGEWLVAHCEARLVEQIASEVNLKGLVAPAGSIAMASLPLLIHGEVIGLIMVFDSTGSVDEYAFNNLKILSSQIAIGVEKTRLYDQVQKLSITDGLTGLFVHRYFQERLDDEIRRAERYGESLSFVMFDIDHFKKYNDTYGHLVGDEVLKRVADLIKGQVGGTDIVSRYGGEEFAVILSNQGRDEGLEKAEKIRKAIDEAVFEFEGKSGKVTISGGLAVYPTDAMTKKGLVDRADQALYRSKKHGRNQITVFEDTGETT